jgi:integrase
MKHRKLTIKTVKALKPKIKRYLVADGDGLYLEIYPTGIKTWCVRHKRDGKPAKTTIGRWPFINLEQARKLAEQLKPTLFAGVPSTTVKEFGTRYMREIVTRDRKDPQPIQRCLEREVYPAIGDKALEAVTVADLRIIIFTKREQGFEQAALAVRDVLKRMWDYAVVCGVAQSNPLLAMRRKYIAKASSRDRALTADEVAEFVCALDNSKLKPRIKAALKLILLTLTRKCEPLHAQWEEIDLDKGEWLIPASKSKNKKPHIVYLSRQAKALFAELAAAWGAVGPDPKHYVLHQLWSKSWPMSESTLNKALDRIKSDVAHFTVHDLRRTATTLLSEREYPADVIDKALNHIKGGVRGVYDRAAFKEQRIKMLQDWADVVEDLAIEWRTTMKGKGEAA